MPKVPTIDSLSVGADGLPQNRLHMPQMADAGRPLRAAGQSMQQAGDAIGQIALDMRQEVMRVRLDKAKDDAIRARQRLTYDPDAGYVHRRGANAMPQPGGKPMNEEYGEAYKKEIDSIAEGLGDPVLKKEFVDRIGAPMMTDFNGGLTSHVAREFTAYQGSVYDGQIKTSYEGLMSEWADPARREQYLKDIDQAVYNKTRFAGLSGVEADAVMLDARSKAHSAIIEAAVAGGDVAFAAEHFKLAEEKGQINSSDRAEIAKIMSAGAGDKIAGTVWKELAPADPNGAVRLFDMDRRIDELAGGNALAAKSAKTAIRERKAAFNEQQRELTAQNIAGVWDMVDAKVPMSRIMQSHQWRALDGKQQHEIEAAREREANTRSGTLVNQLTQREKLLTLGGYDTYLELSDPEVLAKMTPAQIRAQRGVIGAANTEKLLKRHEDITKPGRLGEAKVDEDAFKATVSEVVGIDVYGKLSADEKRKVGLIKAEIESKIDQQQRQAQKQMTLEEKTALMRRELSKEVTVSGGLFGGEKSVPLFNLDRGDTDRVVVPKADFDQIKASMLEMYRRTGRKEFEPTQENIQSWYLRGRAAE